MAKLTYLSCEDRTIYVYSNTMQWWTPQMMAWMNEHKFKPYAALSPKYPTTGSRFGETIPYDAVCLSFTFENEDQMMMFRIKWL